MRVAGVAEIRLTLITVDPQGNSIMRSFRAVIAAVVMLSLVGCGSTNPPVMPELVGKKLDVALSDLKRAGSSEEAEVLGGGILGVIDKGNWTVCEQVPAAGQPINSKPRVKVDRRCESATPGPGAATTTAVTSTPAVPASTTTPSPTPHPPLTLVNSSDFAALAALTDQCSATQTEFASKYAGRVLQFDGSVGALANHGNYKTRYDILVNFGDNGRGTKGPNFQFRDVSITYDLHLTGPKVPDHMSVGDNLRITASVDRFEPSTCLFLIKPVSTEYR